MKKERLQEIKDSIDLQLTVAKSVGTRDEIAEEEKELYDEVVRLKNETKLLLQENEAKEKVIKKQDYVINELEKYIKIEIPEEEFVNSEWYVNILDKLKELKENRDEG